MSPSPRRALATKTDTIPRERILSPQPPPIGGYGQPFRENVHAEVQELLHENVQDCAEILRLVRDIHAKQRLRPDRQREAHHLDARVASIPIAPGGQSSLRVLRHDSRISFDALAMKCRLRQPPLPAPEFSFADQQPVSGHALQDLIVQGFLILTQAADQNLLNQQRLADIAERYGEKLERKHRPVLAYAPLEEPQPIARDSRPNAEDHRRRRAGWTLSRFGTQFCSSGRHDG